MAGKQREKPSDNLRAEHVRIMCQNRCRQPKINTAVLLAAKFMEIELAQPAIRGLDTTIVNQVVVSNLMVSARSLESLSNACSRRSSKSARVSCSGILANLALRKL